MAEYHDDTIRWISEMRLRDYFAAQAMAAVIVWDKDSTMSGREIAQSAYVYAEAMLKERDK